MATMTHTNLIEQTNQYIQAFTSKNLTKVAEFLTEDFVLEDPVVVRVEGKEAALNAIEEIFNANESIDFKAKNIFCDNNYTIIEFILVLGNNTLKGTDVIRWEGGKMAELRAYLDLSKTST
ncbi:nuclear transport factor 2 family protein [Simkania negevensis]|uniref:Nuclear transport factor 2 family protein n=1 Tax=Simkania negevensis TaxID=83561 RepID=A0ABS3AQ46_9BACT|nr:nuclear transport factor 2 family protein [Simkania negevensis]